MKRMKGKFYSLFFGSSALLWAIITAYWSARDFHRSDGFGTFTGIVFLVLCVGNLLMLGVNAFVAVHTWRTAKNKQ